jgi:hypothetical protein
MADITEADTKIELLWDNPERTIIRFVFKPGWGWIDLYRSFEQSNTMAGTVNHMVHEILDIRNASLLPNGGLTQFKKIYANPKHPNTGRTVIVGANSFIKALANMGIKLSSVSDDHWDMLFANSLEHAYELLNSAQQDQG